MNGRTRIRTTGPALFQRATGLRYQRLTDVTNPPSSMGSTAVAGGQELPAHAINHEQIAELVRQQYGGLLSLVRRKLKDRELASELVNEAIAITLEHSRLGRLTELQSIGGYVFRVSMNLLRNHQRNVDNRLDLRADVATLDALVEYESDNLQAAEIRQQARRVIESLASPRDREVIKRFYLAEDDKQVICQELGLTPLQFTQIMSRARQRMKQIFDTQGLKAGDLFSLLV